jgi:hypothetical protein
MGGTRQEIRNENRCLLADWILRATVRRVKVGAYRIVNTRIWGDEKYRGLSDDGKLLFVYLITCRHCQIGGIYLLDRHYIMADLMWREKRLMKAMFEVTSTKMVMYDEPNRVVLVPNFLKYDPIQNPNQAKAAIKSLESLPNSSLIDMFLDCMKKFSKPFVKPFIEGFRKPLPQPDSDADSNTDSDANSKEPPAVALADTVPKITKRFYPPTIEEVTAYCRERGNKINPQRFIDHYNSNGWRVGQNPMRDWKASVRTWESRDGGTNEKRIPTRKKKTDRDGEYFREKYAGISETIEN